MCIPYAGVALLSGVAMCVLGLTVLGTTAAVAGATVGAGAALSLLDWKAGKPTAFYTLTCAGGAAAVAGVCWQHMAQLSGAMGAVNVALLGLSAAIVLFCVYNVAAGGNPPPKKKH